MTTRNPCTLFAAQNESDGRETRLKCPASRVIEQVPRSAFPNTECASRPDRRRPGSTRLLQFDLTVFLII
jgi:hypothetical protein